MQKILDRLPRETVSIPELVDPLADDEVLTSDDRKNRPNPNLVIDPDRIERKPEPWEETPIDVSMNVRPDVAEKIQVVVAETEERRNARRSETPIPRVNRPDSWDIREIWRKLGYKGPDHSE